MFFNVIFKYILETVDSWIGYQKKLENIKSIIFVLGLIFEKQSFLGKILPKLTDSESECWFWLLETVQKLFLTSKWKSILF